MAKPSTQLLLMKARKQIEQLKYELYCSKGFTMQQCTDMAMLALNAEFNFGPAYNKRFEKRFREIFVEWADLCVEDGADDEQLWFTKEKLDQMLRRAYGEDLLPFEQRYAVERIYFRDSREEWKNSKQGGPRCLTESSSKAD